MRLYGALVQGNRLNRKKGEAIDSMIKVIYEDNHLLVCEKPANMPVQADASGDLDLLTLAKEYVKEKYQKPGEVYLGLVHRLDRPVGGVMVFARTSKAAARLTESFKKRTAAKRYAAIVTGNPPDYGKLDDYLIRDEAANITRAVRAETEGAKKASLDFACVTKKNGLALLDVSLHSGRHHQIRVQLASRGYHIYGDQRYNPAAKPGQQIALHAYSLTIEHPTLKTAMTFTSRPSGGAWTAFDEELSALTWGIRLRYIDENIVIVNKNAGIGCAEADAGEAFRDAMAEGSLERLLSCALDTPDILPVHRLDVLTTGLMLYARGTRAQAKLVELIAARKIRKIYHAEVFGCPERKAGRLTLFGVKDSERARVTVYAEPRPGALEMISEYRVLKSDGERSLIEVELITGRTHQIRASLAYIGCPVVGDDKYGDRLLNRRNKTGLHLAAVRLEFPEDTGYLKELSGRTFENDAEFELV